MGERIFRSSALRLGFIFVILGSIIILLQILEYFYFQRKMSYIDWFLVIFGFLGWIMIGFNQIISKIYIEDNQIIQRSILGKHIYLIIDIDRIHVKKHPLATYVKIYFKNKKFSKNFFPLPVDEFMKIIQEAKSKKA